MVSTSKDVKRLRVVLCAILLCLLIPTVLLVAQGFDQLERVSYFRLRADAEDVVTRAERQLGQWVDTEDARSFADYSFLVVAGDNFVQRSPLASFPVTSVIPGLVSYFQLDAGGTFSTPLTPDAEIDAKVYGVTGDELLERRRVEERVQRLLSEPKREASVAKLDADQRPGAQRAQAASKIRPYAEEAEAYVSQSLDRLDESAQYKLKSSLGRVEDLRLEEPYAPKAAADKEQATAAPEADALVVLNQGRDTNFELEAGGSSGAATPATPNEAFADDAAGNELLRKNVPAGSTSDRSIPARSIPTRSTPSRSRVGQKRTEENLAPVQSAPASLNPVVRVERFRSEVEPFRFALLDDAHFALYRTAWRDQTRYTQGMVIERDAFLDNGIASTLLTSRLANRVDLAIAYQGEVLWRQRTDWATDSGTEILLYRDRLAAPFADIEMILTTGQIPIDAGGAVITWAGVALVLLLIGGFFLVYRLGLRQIGLNQQQQDFVSAVSHELKTPLTSIRMYGEILQAGWASEEKKRTYYDFIYQESERLSRLISNVLQLARLTRNDPQLNVEALTCDELMDMVRSKVSTQLEQAGFTLVEDHQTHGAALRVDQDAFAQVMINLVDNAIKFSADAEVRRVELSTRVHNDQVSVRIRDYGPGIPKEQLKKIFQLFYRVERELTRETVGTGIGLALVNELVTAMGGRVDVQNVDPGVEFSLSFPRHES